MKLLLTVAVLSLFFVGCYNFEHEPYRAESGFYHGEYEFTHLQLNNSNSMEYGVLSYYCTPNILVNDYNDQVYFSTFSDAGEYSGTYAECLIKQKTVKQIKIKSK